MDKPSAMDKPSSVAETSVMDALPAPWPRSDVWLRTCSMSVRHAPSMKPGAPAAVFVHGLGGSSLNWTDLMEDLRTDVDCWAIDLGGFGQSPPLRHGDCSPSAFGASVAEFITSQQQAGVFTGPVHLFGNSLGGAVALQVAARRPDLVRSLTLIAPALPGSRVTRANMHLPVIAIPGVGEKLVGKYLDLDAAARVRGTIATCYGDASRMSVQRMNEAIEETESRDQLTYGIDVFLRTLRGLLRSFVDVSPNRPWKLAERITCPTLVIYGRLDPLVDSRAALRVTRHFRAAEVLVLPQAGHVAQMEYPLMVAAAWRKRVALDPSGLSTG